MTTVKKFKTYLIIEAVLFIVGFSLFVPKAYAGFGVSPGGIFNDHLKPGAHFEQELVISRSDPDEELIATIEPELGEMSSWFKFDPGREFLLPYGEERTTVKVIVDVPTAADYKSYQGFIRIKAQPKEHPQGVSVVKGARIDVGLVASEIDVRQLLVRAVDVSDTKEDEPFDLSLRIENVGNEDLAPTVVTLDFLDLREKLISASRESDWDQVPAYATETITAKIPHELPVGEYYVDVKVFLGEDVLREERLVFRVEEKEEVVGPLVTQKQISNGECEDEGWLALLQNKPFMSLLMVVFAGMVVMGWMNNQARKKETQGEGQEQSKMTIVTYSVLGLIVALVGVWLFLVNQDDYQLVVDRCPDYSYENNVVQLVHPTTVPVIFPDVMGAQQTAPPPQRVQPADPLTVVSTEGQNGYNVYKSPQITAPIVYVASEDQVLDVVTETSEWYQVRLPDGGVGWLPKANVKEAR